MNKLILAVATILVSVSSFAAPEMLRCKSQKGDVLFNFYPLTASWVHADGTTTEFLRYGNICNQDVEKMTPKPNCRVEDKSADHYLIQTLECQAENAWFADAFIEISNISKDGRFQCRTKFGTHADIALTLSDCRPY
ncbi:hypothetical protein [Bdellovibrio sp. HCB274]|uniref:hypothetical protein n=1 Tax=Bdellovibrio sp. HCB274 TaxID=3394361 RepID=UPI0039B3EC8E